MLLQLMTMVHVYIHLQMTTVLMQFQLHVVTLQQQILQQHQLQVMVIVQLMEKMFGTLLLEQVVTLQYLYVDQALILT